MTVEQEENGHIAATFPDGQSLELAEREWFIFVTAVKRAAVQKKVELERFISVCNVFDIVKNYGINFVELTEDGKYNLK